MRKFVGEQNALATLDVCCDIDGEGRGGEGRGGEGRRGEARRGEALRRGGGGIMIVK